MCSYLMGTAYRLYFSSLFLNVIWESFKSIIRVNRSMLLFFSLPQVNYFQKEIRLLFYLFVYRVILVDCFNSFSAVINLVSLQVSK